MITSKLYVISHHEIGTMLEIQKVEFRAKNKHIFAFQFQFIFQCNNKSMIHNSEGFTNESKAVYFSVARARNILTAIFATLFLLC